MSRILKHTILLEEKEDYAKIGNSRIGGNPDLPIKMDYPVFENGFYEFILQINLNNHPIIGFPKEGLISIFYGNLDSHEAIAFYSKKEQILENKKVPTDLPFAGVTDFYEHKPYKIGIKEIKLRPREEFPEYNDPQFSDEDNEMHWRMEFQHENSYLMDRGIQDKSHIYLKSNGFEKLIYGYGVWIDGTTNTINYKGRNANVEYTNVNDLKNCQITTSHLKADTEAYNLWIQQLEKYENEKLIHLQRFKDYRCILSLATIDKTEMIWGDSRKLEFFGFESELLNETTIKLNSTIP